jgi:hypothetical protein
MTNRSEAVAAYDRLVATQPSAERKGRTLPYTSMNGNMFSFLTDTGSLALHLAATDRVTFIERYGSGPHEAHGSVMKEYVTVPAPLLLDTPQLAPWFALSVAYAATLKPKPTTRKT